MKTRVQLMDEALGLAGLTSDFYALMRGWLNTIIEQQAREYDWPFYAKTAADTNLVPAVLSYSVPTDFLRPNGDPFVIQGGSRGAEIKMVEAVIFELYRTGTGNGTPRFATIVTSMGATAPVQVVQFDQVPTATNCQFRMPYFRTPTMMSSDSADDTKVPDFLNQAFLIEKLVERCFKFQDDARHPEQAQEAGAVLAAAKVNSLNVAEPTVRLATDTFRPGRGRLRNGYWSWGGE